MIFLISLDFGEIYSKRPQNREKEGFVKFINFKHEGAQKWGAKPFTIVQLQIWKILTFQSLEIDFWNILMFDFIGPVAQQAL